MAAPNFPSKELENCTQASFVSPASSVKKLVFLYLPVPSEQGLLGTQVRSKRSYEVGREAKRSGECLQTS